MRRVALFAAFFVFLAAAPAAAQTEIGMDGAILVENEEGPGDNVTQIVLPLQSVRVGFWTSEQLAIELGGFFQRLSVGGNSATRLGFEGGVVYRLGEWDGEGLVPFLRGGVGLNYLNAAASDTQLGIAFGGGIDIPLAEPLSFRLEGRYERLFESDALPSADVFGLRFGLTVELPGD